MAFRVRVDSDTCTGHGRCYSLSPEVFEADDAGYGRPSNGVVPEELRAKALIGVQNCPERAISISED